MKKQTTLLLLMSTLGIGLTTNGQTILTSTFDTDATTWVVGGDPAGSAAASATFNGAEGNGPGSYDLSVSPIQGPGFASFTYEVSGLNFGTGPVTVSFDGRIQDLVGAATHVRINGNFHGAIMGSFNDTTWSNYSQTYDLTNGFDATNTLTMVFEYGLGAVAGTGGNWQIDNITVSTVGVPEPSTYAAMLGLFAIGFIAIKRRQVK